MFYLGNLSVEALPLLNIVVTHVMPVTLRAKWWMRYKKNKGFHFLDHFCALDVCQNNISTIIAQIKDNYAILLKIGGAVTDRSIGNCKSCLLTKYSNIDQKLKIFFVDPAFIYSVHSDVHLYISVRPGILPGSLRLNGCTVV